MYNPTEPNPSVTRETLIAKVPSFAGEPTAWYAMRAILQEVQRLGMPQSYMLDMAQDFSILHRFPVDRFVYCIRKCGTALFTPPHIGNSDPHLSMAAHIRVFDKECQWYTYDINDVRHGDDYDEPHLRPCTAEEASAFLCTVLRK